MRMFNLLGAVAFAGFLTIALYVGTYVLLISGLLEPMFVELRFHLSDPQCSAVEDLGLIAYAPLDWLCESCGVFR